MFRKCLAAFSLMLFAAAPLAAQDTPPVKAPVDCGSVTCFYFKVTALGKDPQTRANLAMDTINKYLGGKAGAVTTKPAGKNVKLLLNNDLLAVVTPEDAKVEKQKTPAALAKLWANRLSKAFNDTKAQK
ncbi:MAG: hypothetical protein ACK47B_09765 [Armatimonadota bacterium]